MRRSALAAALLILTPGLRAAPGGEDPPPLNPPALEPPAESPSIEKSANRPFLVIPGVTAPAGSAAVAPRKPPAAPPLDGPRVEEDKPRVTLSLPLEPVPADDADPTKRAETGHVEKPRTAAAVPPPTSTPAPSNHRPGVLGRLWGTEGGAAASEDGITIEAHSDPAVEAAVKRRVEKQIQEELGDRVRDVEVRVKARDISIHARASRFWHRPSVRRALDALPLPAGYRGRVEMK